MNINSINKTNIINTHTILLVENNEILSVFLYKLKASLSLYNTDIKPKITVMNELKLEEVDFLSSYPNNHEFIIIGFENNYEKIYESVSILAHKNNYNLNTIDHTNIHHDIKLPDWETYINNHLGNNYNWIVIGDVHGCFNELITLLTSQYGFIYDPISKKLFDSPESKQYGIIFAGDLVDKSSDEDIENTLRFIDINFNHLGDRLHLIRGNHEEMVWRWITNDASLEKSKQRLYEKEIYYNTTFLLEKNSELKNIFLDLYKSMKIWIKTNSFIVTHAPCENKFLGKLDSISTKKQIKCESRSKNSNKTNDEITPYLMIEANEHHPKHIFGHMGQTNVRIFKNKICIDTGCVYGGSLTGYTVHDNIIKYIPSISTKKARNDYSNNLFNI